MKLKFINYLFVLAFLFVSCDDTDDDASSEPLLGLYTISSSVLTSDAVSANGAATVASGTDITSTIVTSFLAEIQCQGSANKAIEVASNNKINFVCRFEDKKQDQGSWLLNDSRSEFTMTLLIQGNLVPLKLTGLQETANSISGNVQSIPVPPTLLASVNPDFANVSDPAVLISIDITLEKLN